MIPSSLNRVVFRGISTEFFRESSERESERERISRDSAN